MGVRDGWDVVELDVLVDGGPDQFLGQVAQHPGHTLVHVRELAVDGVPMRTRRMNRL